MSGKNVKAPKQKKIRNHKILFAPVIGPILGSIIVLLFSELVIGSTVANILMDITGAPNDAMATYMVWPAALGGLLSIFLFKAWFQGKFKGCYSGNWGDKKTVIMIIIMIVLNAILIVWAYSTQGVQTPTLIIIGSALMPGLCEEAAFRLAPIALAMHKARDKKSIYTALIISTVLFGLIHAANVMTGQSLRGTVIQVIGTLGMGVFFGAVYLKTGNLLITLILHTLIDFFGMLQGMAEGQVADLGKVSFTGNIPQLVITVVYIVCGILIIRGSENEILDVWKERWSEDGSEEEAVS